MNVERCGMVSSGVRVLTSALLATFLLAGWATGASAATVTWTGATDALWSTPGNWIGGTPAAGDRLVFPVTASNKTNTNDYAAGTVFFDITFQGGGYTINGNLIGLSNGITNSGTNRINPNLQLTGPQTLGGSSLTLAGNIDIGGNAVSFGTFVTATGVISGTGSVELRTSTILTGNNTYSGLTTLSFNAPAQIDGSQPGSNVQVGQLATLSGNGTVGSVVTPPGLSSRVSPGASFGNSSGRLTTGSLNLGNSSFYVVQLNGSLPGTNYDQQVVNGTVTIGSSVTLSATLGYAPSNGQVLTLIDNDGVDPVSGTFSGLAEGATITLNASDFQISYVGGSGNDVTLTVTGAAKTWTGAVNNLWSVAGNWQGGVPGAGDPLVFPSGASNLTNTNDLPAGTVYKQMLFSAGGYTINGNLIGLSNGITNSGTNRINPNLQLTGPQTLGGSSLTLAGNIDIGGNAVSFGTFVTATGVISGTGSVELRTSTILTGNNTYSGLTTLSFNAPAQIDGSQPGSNVQVGQLATLSGNGTVGSVVTPPGLSSRVSPGASFGNSSGRLTTGSLNLGNSSFYVVQLNGSLPGTNYDQQVVNGTVTIGSSVTLSATLGYAPSNGQVLTLIDNDGVDPVSGTFSGLAEGATITLNASDFQISYVGGSGNDVTLTVTGAAKTWTGAVNNLWSVAGNWQGGVPGAGDPLVFPSGASNLTNTNDLPAGTVYKQMLFSAGGYTINGNLIGLSNGITNSGTNRINPNLQLTGPQTLGGSSLTLAGNIDIGGNAVSFGTFVTATGVISGTGSVELRTSTILTGNNTYSGLTTLSFNAPAQIDGSQPGSNVQVGQLATLSGNGTVGSVVTPPGLSSRVSPGASFGNSSGRLTTGSLNLGNSSFYVVQLNGSLPGTNYDQQVVNGTVTIGSSVTLSATLNYVPGLGQVFVIVENDGTDAVSGTFNGLAQGATVNIGPYPFRISYIGSTGNDITLTSLSGDPLNGAPVAVDDNYMTQQNTQLSVSAPGVLVNDSDPDMNTITVVQAPTTTVQGGTLTVNTNGSFLYQPPTGFSGLDSFGYVISDGNNATANATVRITVIRDPIITASAGTGGSITPSGAVSVPFGTNRTFTIAPSDLCHIIADVLVDSVSVGAVGSYTFTNVQADHTIAASFMPLACTALDQCHVAGTCNPSTGVCSNPNATDGTGCSDANACTQTDTCQSGVCTGSNPVTCTASDQCHVAGTCNSATGLCSNPNAQDGTSCGDAGTQCTNQDTCLSGMCNDNGYQPAGTTCGSSADTVCDNPDTCNASGSCQVNNEPGTTECRADAGECDVAELCDGSGSCPADAYEPAGTTCGSSSDTVCDNPDTCNASGSCQRNNEPGTTECRADAGACDVAELCDGAGSCPADAYEPAGTACGDSSDTVCDNPDTCNASGSCQINNEPGTTECRADAGACDVAELCDGAGSCPADGFEPAGTACGSSADTVCDNPDTCSASGSCQINNEPGTTECRADAGACDVAELCDGAGSCPADGFEPAGTACGDSSDTVCDNPDTCSASGSCQINNEPGTTECRADAGACDVAELCDGAGSCPADGFEPAGTACGDSSDTVCDNPDTCNASGSCQINNEPGTTECRADAGACDVAELCDGAGSCPADGFEPAGTACGDSSDTVCDNPDTCSASGSCQINNEPGTTECRADAGACDVAELCDGAGSCPADGFEPAGTACGDSSDTVCDNPDTCSASGSCQINNEPGTTECRADAGACDVAELCDGAGSCPADGFEPAGTACGDGNACTLTDTCQAGICTGSNPVVCPASDSCHLAGTCNPSTGACSDPAAPDGTACSDGNACTQAGTCQAGVCTGSGPAPDGTACNDGNPCTQTDTCQSGACTGSSPASNGTACNDNESCTQTDTCQSGVCTGSNPVADGTGCDDGSACTGLDTCQSGVCTGDNPVICVASDQCHVAGKCDPATGVCSNPAEANGAPCDDGDLCTQSALCLDGVCTGYEPIVCPASDQCHLPGTCSPARGLCSNPRKADGAACDNGDSCSAVDTCQAGVCTGSAPADDGTACDNGDACTPADVCQGGVCTGSAPLPDGAACNDGNACTQVDTCEAGVCVGAPGTIPTEVGGLQVSRSGGIATISWNPTAGALGYNLLRGPLPGLPVGLNAGSETCLSGAVVGTSATDATLPAANDGFWYVVRGASQCGNGTYGSQAFRGVPTLQRVSATCP